MISELDCGSSPLLRQVPQLKMQYESGKHCSEKITHQMGIHSNNGLAGGPMLEYGYSQDSGRRSVPTLRRTVYTSVRVSFAYWRQNLMLQDNSPGQKFSFALKTCLLTQFEYQIGGTSFPMYVPGVLLSHFVL